MCSAASKILITAATLLILSAGCKEKSRNTDSAARSALNEANALAEKGEYAEALKVFDSIDSLYPGEVEVRGEATALRQQVFEKYCEAQLAEIDSIMTFAETRRNQLLAKMVQNNVAGFPDGYNTAQAGYTSNFYSTTGIQGRSTTTGDFYIVSSLVGRPLHHHSITVTTPEGSVTTPAVEYDGELNMRVNGGEVVSYFGDAPAQIGQLAYKELMADSPQATVTFHGDKGTRTITLTPAQIEGLATTWEFTDNYRQLRHLSIERDRIAAQLDLARRQTPE